MGFYSDTPCSGRITQCKGLMSKLAQLRLHLNVMVQFVLLTEFRFLESEELSVESVILKNPRNRT